MPGGDGRGPRGAGGRGPARGFGRGFGWNAGGGRGRNRGGAFGPGGFCICAGCGTRVPHVRGGRCTGLKCPECGRTMVREELLNERTEPGGQT